MLATNNLVRKMHACETMGAVTVICTDKTGTLTQNKMQVYEVHVDKGVVDKLTKPSSTSSPTSQLVNLSTALTENMAVNSTAFLERKKEELIPIGNPTEGAISMATSF